MPLVTLASRQRIQDAATPTLGSGTLVECDSRQRAQDLVVIEGCVKLASRQRAQDAATPSMVLKTVRLASRERIQDSARRAPTVLLASRQKAQGAADAEGADNRTASIHSVPDGTNPGVKETGESTSW